MKMRRLISAIIALLLVMNLSVTAFAAEWYLEDGSITVSAGDSGQTVSQGSSTDVADDAPVIKQRDSAAATGSTITIQTSGDATANVTIKDINIRAQATPSTWAAPVRTSHWRETTRFSPKAALPCMSPTAM